jgi:hypothetical protein
MGKALLRTRDRKNRVQMGPVSESNGCDARKGNNLLGPIRTPYGLFEQFEPVSPRPADPAHQRQKRRTGEVPGETSKVVVKTEVEPPIGIEPMTYSLRVNRSTD